MHSIYDVELLSLIPDSLWHDEDIQAMCKALSIEIQLISVLHQNVYIWSRIDDLPEELIDHLAVELRSPYYDTALDLDTKRAIVANTLNWYMHLGTPAVVEELITVVFGNGRIQEWWEYGGEPFHFKVVSENPSPDILGDYFSRFLQLLEAVKRKSAWLDGINIRQTVPSPQTFASGLATTEIITIPTGKDELAEIDSPVCMGSGVSITEIITIHTGADELIAIEATETQPASVSLIEEITIPTEGEI